MEGIAYTCRGQRGPSGSYVGCGQNLNALIEGVPYDGNDHVIICPKCKNKVSVMRPKAKLEAVKPN